MRGALVLSLLLLSGTAHAVMPPAKALAQPQPQKVGSEEQLFAQLRQCDSAEDAHPIEAKAAGDVPRLRQPQRRSADDPRLTALGAGDNKTARQLVEAVTNIAPNYAEGWHVRANMEQAAGDDTAALVSLQKAVLLNPRQFAALSELARHAARIMATRRAP